MDLVEASHISVVASLASFLGNDDHMDPFVAGLGHVDALDAACREADHEVVPLDEGDIFADEDALVNDVLEYVAGEVVVRAWDDHASVDVHTSDAAGDDEVAVATFHLFHQAQRDACDADLAAKLEVVDPSSDRDDIQVQASFHLEVQRHYCHCSAEILYFFHVDLEAVELFDHHSATSGPNLVVAVVVDNHFLLNFDYYHFANVPVLLPMVVLAMPLFCKSNLKSLRNCILISQIRI